MIEKRIIRRTLKFTGIVVCVLGVLLTSFHFWFRDHAEEVIEDIVSARSKGTVNLKLKKFRFNYFSRKMELQNAIFYTTDSVNTPTAYRFKIYKIKIELHSLWQLVFNGKLDIESLTLISPNVEAIRLMPVKNAEQREISISQEMGRIYNSIHDAIDFLDAKRFLIQDGTFSVINKIEPGKLPITISHIHFLVDKTEIDSFGNTISPHPNPDNMILHTYGQDISLPDGKHRLSFRNLRINIRKQSIEMDSCTISAEKTDLARTAFRFFFDTLHLSSVDFGALYKYDIIKADSVYCTKPQIRLVLELKDKSNIKTPLPSLKKIIQPLTGDLQLGYVGIRNADINIETNRNDHSTTFTSQNDNIEITGLHINSDSTDPLVVKSFAMAIRDYETLSRDSTLAYRFDSVKFNNSKVVLSNFTVKTLVGKTPPDVERSYTIPMLELNNLSWDELLFNRNIKASKAVLYYPVVNYKRIKPRKQNQRLMLFRDLGNIDAVTELQQVQVINGQLNMEFDHRTRITLQDADLIVSSNELLGSRNIKSIQRSLTQLQFDKGFLYINDLKAALHNVHFTGKKEQLQAEEVTVFDPTRTLSATAKDVVINELYYTDSTKSISVDGLEWQQASVNLGVMLQQSKPSRSSITIKNISGNNTTLTIQNSSQSISTTIRSLALDELRKPVNEKTTISGLHAVGDNFNLVQNQLWIETGPYDINDKKNSVFSNACIRQDAVSGSFTGLLAGVNFIPDIAELMRGHYRFDNMTINEPLIYWKKSSATAIAPPANKLTDLSVADLTVKNPLFYFENSDSSGNTYIQWTRNEQQDVKNEWHLKQINISRASQSISVAALSLRGPGFDYTGNSGKHLEINNGEVRAETENILVTGQADHTWNWSLLVKNAFVKNLNHFTINNKGVVTLQDASAENIILSAAITKNIPALLSNNPSFRLRNSGGSYVDSEHIFNWNNLAFDQERHTLSVDSFSYQPARSRDSLAAAHPYQVDYITTRTGNMQLRNVDLSAYINDTILKAGSLVVENPVITAYRDATKPFRHGYLKSLPTVAIRKIPPFFSLDTLRLHDATVTYMQVDKKTLKTGTIPVTHLSTSLSPIRNYNLTATDSLELNATGMLMDKIPVTLNARESYEDSLAGFRLLLNISPAGLSILNPVLIPLVSAKLKTGYLDSLSMQVNADEYASFGEMKMNYHNLKIAILKKGNENEKTFVTRLANFAANTFFLKHKNSKRNGTVYFERNRERSFFNYLVKMTISGIANSAGIKKDKKKIRRYQREKMNSGNQKKSSFLAPGDPQKLRLENKRPVC